MEIIYFNKIYVITEFLLWLVLGLYSLFNDVTHCSARATGWQLHRAITVMLGAYIILQCLTAMYVYQVNGFCGSFDFNDTIATTDNGTIICHEHFNGVHHGLYESVVIMSNFCGSAFLGLLLLIATGYCITRTKLKSKLHPFAFPLVNFVTTSIVDYIIDYDRAHNIPTDEDDDDLRAPLSSQMQRLVLFIAAFVSLISLFYAWIWILQNIAEERLALQTRICIAASNNVEPLEGVAVGPSLSSAYNNETSVDAAATKQSAPLHSLDDDEDESVFETRTITPREVIVSNPPHGQDETTVDENKISRPISQSEDLTPIPTFPSARFEGDEKPAHDEEEEGLMPLNAKLRLNVTFGTVVHFYLLCLVLVMLYALLTASRAPIISVISDLLTYAAMVVLAYTFRIRHANPYFLVDDFTELDGETVQMEAIKA